MSVQTLQCLSQPQDPADVLCTCYERPEKNPFNNVSYDLLCSIGCSEHNLFEDLGNSKQINDNNNFFNMAHLLTELQSAYSKIKHSTVT